MSDFAHTDILRMVARTITAIKNNKNGIHGWLKEEMLREMGYVRQFVTEAATLKAENEKLREAVRDLAECVSVQLELSRLKENNPNLYNPFLNKHAETISKCGGE